ncbi:DinB family protein [Candidatus Methylospira mobilis]|uniref:DinB family protein n=1 Tax=Candidatus Methylospira mobilis TaxID=1808979 RepID=UPI0028EA2522|nr:DinB family protein [Candidatus Methylospira mobilis]WNV04125.1 DinB family protein [Candidatus Methylospira mobilis]
MSLCKHICLMADYNKWMNAKLYEAAGNLPGTALAENRKAFFGSILGTLNHLVVADTIWLKRFANHPAKHTALEPVIFTPSPKSLDQIMFADFSSLSKHRKWLDNIITEWSHELAESDLDHVLHYANTKGIAANKRFFSLLMHFFNHQTHHRGQITALFSQAGVDVGATDLLNLIPDESGA